MGATLENTGQLSMVWHGKLCEWRRIDVAQLQIGCRLHARTVIRRVRAYKQDPAYSTTKEMW